VQNRAVKQLQKDIELDQAAHTPQPEAGLIISRNVAVTPCSTPCFYDKSCQQTLVIFPRTPLPAMSMLTSVRLVAEEAGKLEISYPLLINKLGNGVDYKVWKFASTPSKFAPHTLALICVKLYRHALHAST